MTARVFGYTTVKDYYEKASSTKALCKIKTPLLVLHALDDPIAGSFLRTGLCLHVAERGIPWDGIAANEYTVFAYTHRGGHLGWFVWGGTRWFVTALAEFFDTMEKTVTSK